MRDLILWIQLTNSIPIQKVSYFTVLTLVSICHGTIYTVVHYTLLFHFWLEVELGGGEVIQVLGLV